MFSTKINPTHHVNISIRKVAKKYFNININIIKCTKHYMLTDALLKIMISILFIIRFKFNE